jgi:hypothetical protein
MNFLIMIPLSDMWERVCFIFFYGRSPKGVVDLAKLENLEDKRSDDASDFANRIQEMHEQVKHKLHQSNIKYK